MSGYFILKSLITSHKHLTFNLNMQNAKWKAADQQSGLQMASNERTIQGLLNVRTPLGCISAIQDFNQCYRAHITRQLVVASAGELSPLQQLMILRGESAVLTLKFQVSSFVQRKHLCYY